jgi:uncharacterized SAM-binding protein YcdF (DUF218 family)
MSFLLKKFVSAFIQPLPICFIIFAIGLYFLFKKEANIPKAKKFLGGGTLLLFLFSWTPLTSFYIAPFENHYEPHLHKTEKHIDYIAVLSSGHTDDKRLAVTEQQGTQSLYRLIEGIRLQKLYPEAQLIFSGYSYLGQQQNADVSKQAAILLGANPTKIVTLYDTKDTAEEAVAIKNIVTDKSLILVTSASHMTRGMGLFKKQGLSPIAAPCEYNNKGSIDFFTKPDAGGLYRSQRAIHETAGCIWAWLTGKL